MDFPRGKNLQTDHMMNFSLNNIFKEVKLLVLLLVTLLLRMGYGYRTYYIEQDCSLGNLTIPLVAGTAGSSVLVEVSQFQSFQSQAMDCLIEVIAAEPKIVVAIRKLGLRTNLNGTCKDYLKMEREIICEKLPEVNEKRHYYSSGKKLTMFYHVDKDGMANKQKSVDVGMKLAVTAALTVEDCSGKDLFYCDNGLCIWSSLRCDTHNNCGDLSDEHDCDSKGGSWSLIILGIIILALLIIMFATTLLCKRNEAVRRFSTSIRSRTLTYFRRFSK